MLLIDLNQVMIANLMQSIGSNPKAKLDENLIRHMILNSLRSYSKQFRGKYGEIVVACDSKNHWRKGVFPYYKMHRKRDRDKSDFDWYLIFETINKIREELKLFFPYRVVEVDGAEADDIIATLVAQRHKSEEILILSSDKDFVQLQKYPNVTQYSPILKRFIKTENPIEYVKEHIIKGDRSDGIPNFLSSDNVFITGERQKNISKKKLAEWIKSDPEDFCTTELMLRNYNRNQMLVDLDKIPLEVSNQIINTFINTPKGSKRKLLDYMIEKGLSNLIDHLDEF